MIPVVEMLRVSTKMQAGEDKAGLDSQRSLNARTAAQQGLEIVASVEIVESGASVATSPEMARVLDEVISGRARGVLLAEYTRLFRPDRWSDMIVLQTISDNDAQIYLPNGPIDLQTETGHTQATLHNLFGAMERRRINERMERNKDEHRKRGAHVSGGLGLPFGVTYSKAAGWGYNADAALVRELFRRFLGGEYNLAALGRSIGIPRKSVSFLLSNPFYSGWRVYTERQRKQDRGPTVRRKFPRRPEDVIRVRLPIEPIVSEEDFARAQELLVTRPHLKPRRRDTRFLYRGMLDCSCGHPVYTTTGNGKHYYFCKTWCPRRVCEADRCENGYMAEPRIEELLDAAIVRSLTDPDVLEAAIGSYLEESRGPKSAPIDRVGLQRRIKALEEKRGRILEAFFDAVISKSERDNRLGQIDAEIATTHRLVAHVEPTAADSQDMVRAIETLVATFGQWSRVDWAARRGLLEAMSPTFTVRKYGVDGVRFPVALLNSAVRDSGGRCRTLAAVANESDWKKAGGLYVPLSA